MAWATLPNGKRRTYRSGKATVTDLNLAQTQLLQAKNASADSHVAALSAAATLAFATGALGAAPM